MLSGYMEASATTAVKIGTHLRLQNPTTNSWTHIMVAVENHLYKIMLHDLCFLIIYQVLL